jgi:radical SAM protein with 4Fe4S-binding SPASM domain
MATIARLRAASMPVHVITSISKQNLAELPRIHELLKAQRVDCWILQLAHRTGRLAPGEADGSCEPIEPRELLRVADFIVRHAGDPVLRPMAFNSIGYLSRQEPIIRQSGRRARHPIWRGCQCGVTTIGIEPDGGIKGCANQVGAPFVVGNIRAEPLHAIWRDRARWHWVKPTADRLSGDCANCALARFCGAGCTTLALRSSGELFNNPYCLRVLERRYAE